MLPGRAENTMRAPLPSTASTVVAPTASPRVAALMPAAALPSRVSPKRFPAEPAEAVRQDNSK